MTLTQTQLLLTKKEQVVQDFKQTMKEYYGDRLSEIILFGSYARGDFHEESDIDFLVVLKDEEVEPYREIYNVHKLVTNLILQHDMIISYVPTSSKRLKSAKTPLFFNVKKEGVII